MQACRSGGTGLDTALRGLHGDYAGALLNEGFRCVGDAETARELVQETLLKAWRRCASFRGESELFPWLRNILRHSAIDWLRQRRPEQALDDADGRILPEIETALASLRADLAQEPERLLQDAQLQACYRACAAKLAQEQPLAAAVIRWVAEDDLSHEQIAALLQRSPGATREFISQCRKKARLYFRDWYRMVREHASEAAE